MTVNDANCQLTAHAHSAGMTEFHENALRQLRFAVIEYLKCVVLIETV